MPLRDFRIPNQSGAWDWEEVAAYLTAKGYQIGPGKIGTGLDAADPTTVIVRVDLDAHIPDETVQADLAAFAPDHSPEATAQVAMRQALATLAAADEKTPIADQVAALRTVVLAYAATLNL